MHTHSAAIAREAGNRSGLSKQQGYAHAIETFPCAHVETAGGIQIHAFTVAITVTVAAEPDTPATVD